MADLDAQIRIKAVDQSGSAFKSATRSIGQFENRAKRAGKSFQTMGQRAEKAFNVAGSLSLASSQAGRFSAALTRALSAPIRKAVEFDDAMRAVRAKMGGTSDDFQMLSKQAAELGRTTRFTAVEAAQGMEALGMAGFNASQVMAAMPDVLNLTAASGEDLGRVADIASDIMGGFSIKATEMGRVSDVLTATFTNSNTTLSGLGESLKFAAPVARELGLSLEQTAAATGLLGSSGIKGSQAGTALRAMMTRLAKVTPRVQKQLHKYNLTLKDLDASDFLGTLQRVNEKTKDLTKNQRLAALATVFGQEAMSGAAVVLKEKGAGALDEFIDNLGKSAGATDKAAKIMESGAGGAGREFTSAMDGLSTVIGQQLLPELVPLVKETTATVSAFANWSAANPGFITGMFKLGASLAVATKAVSLFAGAGSVIATSRGGLLKFTEMVGKIDTKVLKATSGVKGLSAAYSGLSKAIGVAGAAFVGWEIGEWLNETFNLTTKLSDAIAGLMEEFGVRDTYGESLRAAGGRASVQGLAGAQGEGGAVYADGSLRTNNVVTGDEPEGLFSGLTTAFREAVAGTRTEVKGRIEIVDGRPVRVEGPLLEATSGGWF